MRNKCFGKFTTMALLCCAIHVAQAKPLAVAEADVKNCQFLGTVEGNSGYGKNPNWETTAKWYAQKKAEQLGATHIVFTQTKAFGAFNGKADAKSFVCQPPGNNHPNPVPGP